MALVGIPAVLRFVRPSGSRPGQWHEVAIDGPSLAPLDCEHPCTCPAGEAGRYCWATLSILQVDCVAEAGHRYYLTGDIGKPEAEALLLDVVQRGIKAAGVVADRAARSRVV